MSLIMNKIAKTAISAAVVLGLAAGSMAPLATSASAGDWRGRNSHFDGRRYDAPRAYHYDAPRRRSNGSQIAKGLAIGIGAAVVGAIIADSARRARAEERYDY
jgi:hypothetical protein